MKIVISNKIYCKPSDELWEYLLKHTSYQIFKPGAKYPLMFQNSGSVGKEIKWFPVTRLDLLESFGQKVTEVVDKRTLVPVDMPKPSFTLRPGDQLPIYEDCNDTCIINGKPGFGKTILALAIAHKLGQKTLVICTNTTIRAMWEKEVRKFFGIEPGVIGSGKFNIDSPIVISNIQTVNKHGAALAKEFGTVIVDEVHHCVATTFTKFLEQSSARYKIGLSGTLKRKDGLQVMFKDYFGTKVYSPPVNNTLPPTIHRFALKTQVSGNMNVPWAIRANDVYSQPEYFQQVVDLCELYSMAGHKVLFVSDRIDLIERVTNALELRGVKTYTITGVTSLDDREQVQIDVTNDGPCVLAASQSIFSEGVSLNALSCLVLGSLINNESLIEQLAGRVQRMADDKLDPILVDLKLGGVGFKQAAGREAVYRLNGWEVLDFNEKNMANLDKILFAKNPKV